MAAGSIIVDLLMRTGSFETDTARAEKRLKAFQKQAEATGKAIGIALAAGATLAVVAFEKLLAAAGDFKDLEEQTGASAEALASLSVIAAVAGTSVADLAGLMNKLTKNLSGVDDESKAAGAALSALGIPIEKFKDLDPVGQVDALAAAFNGFADGSEKTAVAMALFGKNGAQMLTVFKELEASGGRQVILTQQQIELADEYSDRQKRLTAQIRAYAEAAVVDVLPALNDLTRAAKEVAAEFFGVDAAGKKLAGESPVKEFADKAVGALAFVVDAGQGVARIFQAIGVGIGAALAAVVEYQSGNVRRALTIAQAAREDIDKILSAELFSQRLQRLRDEARTLFDPANQSPAELRRAAESKPRLKFDGAQKQQKAAAESEAQRYLENLKKQIEKTQELTAYEQALADIQQKRIKGITPELERQILAEARHLDLVRAEKEARDAQVATTTRLHRAQVEELEGIAKGNREIEREIELLGLDEDGKRALELQATRVARAEKELTLTRLEATGVAEQQLQVLQAEIDALKERESLLTERNDKAIDAAAKDAAKRSGDSYRDALGDSIEEGILDGFRRGQSLTDIFVNELKAQFGRTVLRPIIQPFVDSGNQVIRDIVGAIGGVIGGSTAAPDYGTGAIPGRPRGGAAGGTNLVQRDMITLLHKGEAVVPKAYNPAAGGGTGPNVKVVVNAPAGTRVDRQEERDGPDGREVEIFMSRIEGRIAGNIAKGRSPINAAMQARGISQNGGNARRG